MEAVAWSDYICPWAYLGRDRTALLRDLGVAVTVRPFELHPEIPVGGRENRRGGRLDRVFAIVQAECDELGIPFRRPERTPSSRRALEVAEIVRAGWPEAFGRVDEALSRGHWVEGIDIGDPTAIDAILAEAGVPPAEVGERWADGDGTAAVDASMAAARERGVTATPAWWVGDALLIPGAQPRETMRRWITRLLAAEADRPSPSA